MPASGTAEAEESAVRRARGMPLGSTGRFQAVLPAVLGGREARVRAELVGGSPEPALELGEIGRRHMQTLVGQHFVRDYTRATNPSYPSSSCQW
jgi:hypothetical protein